jgi:hypothetical protein
MGDWLLLKVASQTLVACHVPDFQNFLALLRSYCFAADAHVCSRGVAVMFASTCVVDADVDNQERVALTYVQPLFSWQSIEAAVLLEIERLGQMWCMATHRELWDLVWYFNCI